MNRILRYGDQGQDVKALQDVLNFHIRRLEPLAVDGKFGPKTKARVVEFQRVNKLQVDGAVGNQTNSRLYAIDLVPFSLALIPLGSANSSASFSGSKPPPLVPPLVLQPIPPLVLPGTGIVIPGLPGNTGSTTLPMPMVAPLMLRPQTIAPFPRINPAGQVLNLSMAVPSRSDPADPAQKSYQQIVGLLQTLPSNFPFRAAIIDAVPKPVTVPAGVGTVKFGFDWGVSPLFDVKAISPPEYSYGAEVKAKYVLRLVDQPGTGLKLGLFAAGDFTGELKFNLGEAAADVLLQLQGNVMFGAQGNF